MKYLFAVLTINALLYVNYVPNNQSLGKSYQPQPSAIADKVYLNLNYSSYRKKNDVVVEETSAYNAVLLKPSSRWKKTPVDLDETSASNSFAIITISMSDCF